MQTGLRRAIAETGIRYRHVVVKANRHLAPDDALTELRLSQLATGRAAPSPQQARALARVLRVKVRDLFPRPKGGAA